MFGMKFNAYQSVSRSGHAESATGRDGARLYRHVALLLIALLVGCRAQSPEDQESATRAVGNARVEKNSLTHPGSGVAAPSGDHKGLSQLAADLDSVPSESGTRVEHHLRFTDVAVSSGVDFTYLNGAKGESLMVESTGGGCGWLDYDSDGHWDLYLVQGGDPTQPPSAAQPADRLYRNLDDQRFADITASCRIDERDYGQGTAIADFDGDGFDDIFVTNVGRNRMYHNQGDGTFVETQSSVFGRESLWSSSSAWGDIDRDGDLDLYVCRYVIYDPMHPRRCFRKSGGPGICHPKEVEPSPDECYLNEGDGNFRPAAQELGLFGPNNRALGVAIADLDNDGWPDIFVANDTTDNFLFINQQNGKFQDQARVLGCAININGSAQANMGIAVGDYDCNGFLDLYISHFYNEWNTLYQNLGKHGFHDVTAAVQLSVPTMDKLGWGTVMADFDQNGYEDLIVTNGHVADLRADGIDFDMTNQLFAFNGNTWDDCSVSAGPYFEHKYQGRGLATCDFDEDGDLDVVIVNQNEKTSILRNDSQRGHWLKIALIGSLSNRRGIGARVTLRSEKNVFTQELVGGSSYCASNQPALVFGLGSSDRSCDLEVRWPGGDVQMVKNVRPDQSIVVRQSESPVPVKP
jgi:hypothetical protein